MIHTIFLVLSFIIFPSREISISQRLEVDSDTLTIPVLNYEELRPLLHLDNDTTYVVNFWATWCVPCVKELPYFIQLDSIHKNDAFRLVLVSLDFKKDYLRKLQPFVRERSLERNVLVLEDNRSNYWIDDIDKSWGGSIPATLVYKGKERAFYERTFERLEQLSDIVKPYLNH